MGHVDPYIERRQSSDRLTRSFRQLMWVLYQTQIRVTWGLYNTCRFRLSCTTSREILHPLISPLPCVSLCTSIVVPYFGWPACLPSHPLYFYHVMSAVIVVKCQVLQGLRPWTYAITICYRLYAILLFEVMSNLGAIFSSYCGGFSYCTLQVNNLESSRRLNQ